LPLFASSFVSFSTSAAFFAASSGLAELAVVADVDGFAVSVVDGGGADEPPQERRRRGRTKASGRMRRLSS
jgi:hypothetical protein